MAPHTVAYLAGWHDAANVQPFKTPLPPFPLAEMVYTQLIQSGCTKIHLARDKYTILAADSYLQDRVTLYEPNDELSTVQRVDALMKAVANPDIQKDDTVLTKLVYLTTDILLALQKRGMPVMVTRMPTEDEVFKVLQPKAAVAVAGLVRTITQESALVPLPTMTMEKKDARLFEEILQSDFFTKYGRSHESLEDASIPKSHVLLDLRDNASKLQRRFSHRLDLRPSLIPLFQVTSKVVDTVFGRLPGALAEMFANSAERLMEERSRVVLVHAGSAIVELFERRMKQMLESFSENAS